MEKQVPNDSEYLTTDEAAKELGLSPETVRGLCREGKLPCRQKYPRAPWEIRADAVENWHPPQRNARAWLRWMRDHPAVILVGMLFAIISLVAGLIQAGADFPAARQLLIDLNIVAEFPAERTDEWLIVIANFDVSEGAVDTRAHNEIETLLEHTRDELGLDQLRIGVSSSRLSARERDQAESLAEQYGASMIIWGEDTGVRVTVNFLNLKQPQAFASDVRITEIDQTQLASPDEFASFIVEDLPSELTYLSLFAAAQYYLSDNKLSLAVQCIDKGIASLGPDAEPAGMEDTYFVSGYLHQELQEDEEAKHNYTKALEIDPDHVGALNNVGSLLQQMGNLVGALPYLERALVINEKTLGNMHPDTATSLNNVGGILYAMGDLDGAHPYFERALAIRKEVLGPKHPDTAQSLNNMGGLLEATGDLANALPFYKQALVIWQEVLGEKHPDTANSLNNMGALLHTMGDLDGARSYIEQALAINEEVLGDKHVNTARTLNNLGALLQAIGELADAQICYERAHAIFEESLGEMHPDTAQSLNNMGMLLQAIGDLSGAQTYLERALAIREEILGSKHPDTAQSLSNMGYLLLARGDLAGARPYFEQALAIFEEVLGEKHPTTAVCLSNMGVLLHNMDDLAGARPYFEQALDIRIEVLGKKHPATAQSLNNMGYLLEEMGDPAGARPYFEQALAIYEEVLGPDHAMTQLAKSNLESLGEAP